MGYDRGRSREAPFRDEERGGSERGRDHNSSNVQNWTDSTWRNLWCHSALYTVNSWETMYLTWTQLQKNMFCLLGGEVFCFFVFFLPAWYAKLLFCQQHLSLTGPLQPINVEKDKPSSRPRACFLWRRAALWQTYSLWLLSGIPFLACTLSVLLTPGHWG